MTAVRRLERVLFAVPSAGLGGAEAHSLSLARALTAAGVAVRIGLDPALLAPVRARFNPPPDIILDAAPLAWMPTAPLDANLDRQAAATAALLAARPDAVVLPLPWPNWGLGVLRAAAAAGVPVLAIAYLVPHEFAAEAADVAAADLRLGRVRWAAVADPTARRLAEVFALPRAEIAVVTNGVPKPSTDEPSGPEARFVLRERLGMPARAPLLLFVGRLDPVKGADLLPALAAAARARCGATLAALGEGPLAPTLRRAAARLPGRPLRLLGQVADVPAWLHAADTLLLPSRLEGCPLVFLEAALRRLPVVATAAALEAFGEAAPELASVICAGDDAGQQVTALIDHVSATLADPGPQPDAAQAAAAALDDATTLRAWFGLLRGLPT